MKPDPHVHDPLRLLILEDRADDAALITGELRRAGLRCEPHRVETRETFLQELDDRRPDIILSDHAPPAFDGFTALEIARQHCPDVPFVFVTGALGEEFAIKTFEGGAADYVLKHHLSDLAPAVRRALDSAEERRDRHEHAAGAATPGELSRLLVENITDCALFLLDASGRVLTWNPGAERIAGYTPAEMIGRHTGELLDGAGAMAAGHRLLALAAERGHNEFDTWCRHKNGARLWMNTVVTAIRDETGALRGFAVVARDMTGRKDLVEALRRSEQRARSIFETAMDAVVLMDGTGSVREWNTAAERLFGHPREAAVGRLLHELIVPPRLHTPFRQTLERHLTGTPPTSPGRRFQATALRADGSEFPVEMAVTEAQADGSRMFTGHITDITARQHTEEGLRRKNREMERRVLQGAEQLGAAYREMETFSHSISHDLRAPLRHICGFVELLQESASGVLDAANLEYLNIIAVSAGQMSKLMDDILSYSRAGRGELRHVPVKLGNSVGEALKELRREMEGRDVRVNIAPLPEVAGDPEALRQVFVHLLSNALKFTRPRPQAVIEIFAGASDDGREQVVSLRDNGVGFDGAYAHKLFGVFQRLHPAKEFCGSGVGLAIVRRLVARQGGRTWAEGAVDRGATFHIALPKEGATP